MRRAGRHTRLRRFIKDVSVHTPFTKMVLFLIALWLLFSAGLYLAEKGVEGSSIDSYRGVAAFSTAGIADAPISTTAQLLGGVWIVLGSVLFFGAIVATITTYFVHVEQLKTKQLKG